MAATCKPWRKASEDTDPADSLHSCEDITVCCCGGPGKLIYPQSHTNGFWESPLGIPLELRTTMILFLLLVSLSALSIGLS